MFNMPGRLLERTNLVSTHLDIISKVCEVSSCHEPITTIVTRASEHQHPPAMSAFGQELACSTQLWLQCSNQWQLSGSFQHTVLRTNHAAWCSTAADFWHAHQCLQHSKRLLCYSNAHWRLCIPHAAYKKGLSADLSCQPLLSDHACPLLLAKYSLNMAKVV